MSVFLTVGRLAGVGSLETCRKICTRTVGVWMMEDDDGITAAGEAERVGNEGCSATPAHCAIC